MANFARSGSAPASTEVLGNVQCSAYLSKSMDACQTRRDCKGAGRVSDGGRKKGGLGGREPSEASLVLVDSANSIENFLRSLLGLLRVVV